MKRNATAPGIAATNGRHGLSASDVIATWRSEGAIERLATGWPTFDEASRGGFVLGRLGFLLGAPNAWKTATLGCFAWRWLHEQIAVGVLLVDEDVSDFVTRLAVQSGVTLDAAEERSTATLAKIQMALAALPLRLYDPSWTIEAAAADFAAWMRSKGFTRGAFLADSLQTIECDASRNAGAGASLRVSVGQNVKALASVASTYRFATIATGEIPRASYDGRGDDMRAGKESGAIEFAAKIQIVLRRDKRDDSLVRVSVPKIKRGSRDETAFALRFDRTTHTLGEDEGAPPAAVSESALAAARKRIIALTATRKGLSSSTKIADAAGGKRQAIFAAAKAMIASGELQLVGGSYRPKTEPTP
jgi:hypothetical protein